MHIRCDSLMCRFCVPRRTGSPLLILESLVFYLKSVTVFAVFLTLEATIRCEDIEVKTLIPLRVFNVSIVLFVIPLKKPRALQ